MRLATADASNKSRRRQQQHYHPTWFSTTHFRPCSHSTRGGPADAPPAAFNLPSAAAAVACAGTTAAVGAAGTDPLRSARNFAFMSSAATERKKQYNRKQCSSGRSSSLSRQVGLAMHHPAGQFAVPPQRQLACTIMAEKCKRQPASGPHL
jgi:hypothetical protein